MRYIRLQHEVVHARYDEQAGKWRVRIRRPKPGGSEGETEELGAPPFQGTSILGSFDRMDRFKRPPI